MLDQASQIFDGKILRFKNLAGRSYGAHYCCPLMSYEHFASKEALKFDAIASSSTPELVCIARKKAITYPVRVYRT